MEINSKKILALLGPTNTGKTFVAIEDAMEPFKDQRKDLRESYNENGWLTKEEMRLAVKAYRLYKSETDMEVLADYVNKCQRSVGRLTNV